MHQVHHRICLYHFIALRKWHLNDNSMDLFPLNLQVFQPHPMSCTKHQSVRLIYCKPLIRNLDIVFMFQSIIKGIWFSTVCILELEKFRHFFEKTSKYLAPPFDFIKPQKRCKTWTMTPLLLLIQQVILQLSPSDWVVFGGAAVPVAVGCFYITGNLCCFHSTMELGRNGEKCMSDI